MPSVMRAERMLIFICCPHATFIAAIMLADTSPILMPPLRFLRHAMPTPLCIFASIIIATPPLRDVAAFHY